MCVCLHILLKLVNEACLKVEQLLLYFASKFEDLVSNREYFKQCPGFCTLGKFI